ncbi:unnamed protein product [Ceratitis capitata]|uniref:(Mediterranean fruit fly) hypothetical protein n=1 Tax=Ceratitis capitata TaxID=7213 RepID=A0A811U731_CERCA|nr:unnamed protein product [Ceratitis capitata]
MLKPHSALGHPGLNRGPLDLQSNALPLSYIPNCVHVDIKAHTSSPQRQTTLCTINIAASNKYYAQSNKATKRDQMGIKNVEIRPTV